MYKASVLSIFIFISAILITEIFAETISVTNNRIDTSCDDWNDAATCTDTGTKFDGLDMIQVTQVGDKTLNMFSVTWQAKDGLIYCNSKDAIVSADKVKQYVIDSESYNDPVVFIDNGASIIAVKTRSNSRTIEKINGDPIKLYTKIRCSNTCAKTKEQLITLEVTTPAPTKTTPSTKAPDSTPSIKPPDTTAGPTTTTADPKCANMKPVHKVYVNVDSNTNKAMISWYPWPLPSVPYCLNVGRDLLDNRIYVEDSNANSIVFIDHGKYHAAAQSTNFTLSFCPFSRLNTFSIYAYYSCGGKCVKSLVETLTIANNRVYDFTPTTTTVVTTTPTGTPTSTTTEKSSASFTALSTTLIYTLITAFIASF